MPGSFLYQTPQVTPPPLLRLGKLVPKEPGWPAHGGGLLWDSGVNREMEELMEKRRCEPGRGVYGRKVLRGVMEGTVVLQHVDCEEERCEE